jgi:hypothetical protein
MSHSLAMALALALALPKACSVDEIEMEMCHLVLEFEKKKTLLACSLPSVPLNPHSHA